MFDKIDLRFSVFPSLSFIFFGFLLKTSGLSLTGIVNLNNDFIKKAIVETAGMSTYQTIIFFLTAYGYVFLAFIFLSIGLAFIASFATQNTGTINALVPAIAGSLFVFFLLGISMFTGFISLALIVSSIIVFKQSAVYFNEIKKWRYFRTGSHSIGHALVALNIILALGALIAVNSNQAFYETTFKQDIKNVLTEVVLKEVGEDEKLRATAQERVQSTVENSSIISGYLRFLPIMVAVEIWILLEMIRFFIANAGGLFTHLILKNELGPT